MARYLSHAVLHQGRVCRHSVVELCGDGRVAIRPFAGEEPQTVFVGGIVAVCDATRMTAAHSSALAALVVGSCGLERAVAAANGYLAANGLYLREAAAEPCLLPLPYR